MAGVKGKGGKKGIGRRPSHYRGPDGAQCTSCKKIKPYSEYSEGNPRTCRRCKYGHHLKRKYGLDKDAYDALLVSQGGLCAICRRREPKYVDHHHASGRVRGVLCQPCNTALGAFYEDVELFDRAIKDLSR